MVAMDVHFDIVELVVSDMAASLAFYRALGLDVPEGAEQEPHVDVGLSSGVRIAFDTVETVRSFDPSWRPAAGGHRMALAFSCASPAMVDETYRQMLEQDHEGHLEPFDAFWGQRYAVLHDPDGNPVDLYCPLPTS